MQYLQQKVKVRRDLSFIIASITTQRKDRHNHNIAKDKQPTVTIYNIV
jgi:hypothetical protein